ncbi:MAG: MerR family transcriptional regulator [Defluviitaleaceae bacterium]|nr:MerR family transcriptional regulator [Defluviitaleaceae bacterium]
MGKFRAIPAGLMTVGEVAKKMGVSVRTLQYYDREGLLKPSAQSEGGRRLYNHKSLVELHQILALRYLGFSLDDIKGRLACFDEPKQMAEVLEENAKAIKQKMRSLQKSLEVIEALKAEVVQMQTVDFDKYAVIVSNLQMENDMYWLIKYFDEEMLAYLREKFDEEGAEIMNAFKRLIRLEAKYIKNGVAPESEQGQAFAKEYWETVIKFTGGDEDLIAKLSKIAEVASKEQKFSPKDFIEPALGFYFANLENNANSMY